MLRKNRQEHDLIKANERLSYYYPLALHLDLFDMLSANQICELLRRCEAQLNRELSSVRGNLRQPAQQSAAVWELLVIDATSRVGPIQYEPLGSGPDIALVAHTGRDLFIEATYLYPRFLEEERRSQAVRKWIYTEASNRGITPAKLFVRLDGERTSAGAVRVLPELHKPSEITKCPDLLDFFKRVQSKTDSPQNCKIRGYSIDIHYHPDQESHLLSSAGLAQESPIEIEDHALFLKAKEKESQLRIEGPAILCIGSDTSPALSHGHDPRGPSLDTVVRHIFNFSSISALMVTNIAYVPSIFGPSMRHAKTEIYVNSMAKYRLEPAEVSHLQEITFNHWKYSAPLANWKERPTREIRPSIGSLVWRYTAMGIEIEVPARLVLEALAGKSNAVQAYGLEQDDVIRRALDENWQLVACTIKEDDIEQGEPQKIVMELANIPPYFSLNKNKKSQKSDGS